MAYKNPIARSLAFAVILVIGAATCNAQTPASVGASVAVNPETQAPMAMPATVRLGGQDLFEVSAPMGALTAAQRAQAIEKRLIALAQSPASTLSTLRLADGDGYTGIYAGALLIRSVTAEDAAHTGRTRRELAAAQLAIIRRALSGEYHDRGISHILRSLLISALATILLIALLIGLQRLYRWTRARITRAAQAWHWQSGLARLRLLSPGALASASRSVARALAGVIAVLLVYFYFEVVLSQFPWTRGIAAQMVDAAEHAVTRVFTGLLDYLPSLFSIIVIVFVARIVLKALKFLAEQIATQRLKITGFYPEWGRPTYSLARFFVIAMAAVMVFPYLPGSGSAGFQGISVFVGVLISFGAASSIANVLAGVIITYMRPFRIGDRVKIADAVGDVTDKNLLVVRIKTIKNVDITIPNALVLANHIINFSANATDPGLILHTTVTIGYDAPWKQVHELLIAAAKRVDSLLAEPAPFVLQTSLDDFYVSYQLNAYTNRAADQAALYSRLHEAIQDTFYESGVEILSPHYTAVRDGNRKGVPDEYLPKNYKAPGFNIRSTIRRSDRDT